MKTNGWILTLLVMIFSGALAAPSSARLPASALTADHSIGGKVQFLVLDAAPSARRTHHQFVTKTRCFEHVVGASKKRKNKAGKGF